jgi:Cu/Ag efflux pump CusA
VTSTRSRKRPTTARVVSGIAGAGDVRVQQVTGLPMLQIAIDRDAIARYGINVADVQELVQTAIAGTEATRIMQGVRRFELVVRLPPEIREEEADFGELLVSAPNGQAIPLAQLARISRVEGPVEVSREEGQRRITVETNVRGRDIGSFVEEAQAAVAGAVTLPAGYVMRWGGLWENLESGWNRLLIAVPITFVLIFLPPVRHLRVCHAGGPGVHRHPFAVTGGVLALLVRGLNFDECRGRLYRRVGRGGAERSRHVGLHQRTATRREPPRWRPFTGRCPRSPATGPDDGGCGQPGLPADGPVDDGRSRSSAPTATVVIGGLVTSTALAACLASAVRLVVWPRGR